MTLITWRECRRLLLLFCVYSSIIGTSLSAQGLTTGVLQGTVADQSGMAVRDVLLTLTSQTTGASRSVTTDISGSFRFSQLPAGDFDLLVEHPSYRPVRVVGVPVRPGQRLAVRVGITASTGPVAAPEIMRFEGGVLSGTLPQFGEWFTQQQLSQTPFRSREFGEVLRLSSTASQQGGIEGLPARMLGLTVDATPYRSANPELNAALGLTSVAIPMGSLEAAQLATNSADVERSGFAGAMLNGYSRHGTATTQPRLLAQYVATATGDELDDVDRPTDVQAAAVLSGALVRDSAHFVVGAEFRQYQTPLQSFWMSGDEANGIMAAAASSQISLDPYLQPHLSQTEAITGFAGAEWQVSGRHRVEVRAAFGVAPHADQFGAVGLFSVENQAKANSIVARAALLSDLSSNSSNELRLGVTFDGIDVEPQSEGDFATDDAVPITTFVGSGLTFGGAVTSAATYRRREFSLSDAFTAIRQQHQFKIGVAAELAAIEQTRSFQGPARTFFGGTAQFATDEGALFQPIGSMGTAEFTLAQVAGFAQDTWRPSPGLDVLLGVRYEQEMLPVSDIAINQEWLRLTALNNGNAPKSYGKVSPRFSVKWDPQEKHRWIIGAGVAVYHATADADLVASAIGNDGRTRVARRLGTLTNWPAAITDTAGSARSLTIIGPNYRPPVSTRASAGITRMLDAYSALHVSASYRDTRHLPRGVDLNGVTTALSEDQYGRAVFGELVQQGELVAANPVTNRRFAGFDQVIGINSDGKSQYRGVTVLLERIQSGFGVHASYTYSQTEDNWYGAANWSAPSIAPRLNEASDDWADGTSDFDVPHRVAVSAEFQAPAGIALSALYRYESGMPFTPSLPQGVDVGGDGFTNDPAFIDEDVAGTSELISAWSCLRSQIGQIAERNSCRSDALQSLDLRLSARIGSGARAVQINVDALNVLQSESGIIDNALYRVDADAQLTTSGGVTTIPFVSNPRFGEIRERLTLPRIIRVGVQFNW